MAAAPARPRACCTAALLLALAAAPARASEVLTCITHESWTSCTADLDLGTFRGPDTPCGSPAATAGFCVCRQAGCVSSHATTPQSLGISRPFFLRGCLRLQDAEANLIRIETACDDVATCDVNDHTSKVFIAPF